MLWQITDLRTSEVGTVINYFYDESNNSFSSRQYTFQVKCLKFQLKMTGRLVKLQIQSSHSSVCRVPQTRECTNLDTDSEPVPV